MEIFEKRREELGRELESAEAEIQRWSTVREQIRGAIADNNILEGYARACDALCRITEAP